MFQANFFEEDLNQEKFAHKKNSLKFDLKNKATFQ